MDYKLLLLLLPLFLIIYFFACRFDDNANKYSRENIKLELYDEKYVYIKKVNEFLFPKKNQAILELYKVGDIIECDKVDTGYIKIKQILTESKKVEELFSERDNQGNMIKKDVYLYMYEIYDPKLITVNDIKINIENLYINKMINMTDKENLKKIEEKIDILLDHNLTQDKIKEFEDWLDFIASLPIPAIESIIKLIKIYIKKARK
jgi:hypothetical protein